MVRPAEILFWLFGTAGFAASLGMFLAFGVPEGNPSLAVILGSLALIAEFLPVQLSKRGLRVTFTLPYIAALAVVFGPFGAVAADIGVAVLGGFAATGNRAGGKGRWILFNASVAALSCSLAGVAFEGLRAGSIRDSSVALAAAGFASVYVVANLVLVAVADRLLHPKRRFDALWSDARMAAQSLALYALFAVAVAVLAATGLGYYAPLTLVPVWALRTAFDMRARLYSHYYETMTALTLMLQRAHPYTHGHLERVAEMAEDVALRLGLSSSRARMVREAAVLHDIGKIAVNEQILDLPRGLTESEYDHVRNHSDFGAQILSQVPQFQPMVPWIRHHHERLDGRGYPARLTDAEIPIESKIICVVDAFDAMVGAEGASGQRSYRDPMTVDEALKELNRCAGTQFDPRVVRAFEQVAVGGVD